MSDFPLDEQQLAQQKADRSLRRALGVVTDDDPLTVEIGDVPHVGLRKLRYYDPVVGDRVYCVRRGRELTVLGEVG